jgi:hypothetical protein
MLGSLDQFKIISRDRDKYVFIPIRPTQIVGYMGFVSEEINNLFVRKLYMRITEYT